MARSNPQVITGARGSAAAVPVSGPGTFLEELIQSNPNLVTAVKKPLGEGVRRYLSKAENLRFQVTAPKRRVDPATGYDMSQEEKVAQFREGVFETDDPEIQARIENSPKYGLGNNMWSAEVQLAYNKTKAAELASNSLDKTDFTDLSAEQIKKLRTTLNAALEKLPEQEFTV